MKGIMKRGYLLIIILIFILLHVVACGYLTSQDQAADILLALKEKVPDITLLDVQNSHALVPGHYSSAGPTARKRGAGLLSGSDLYLFHDGTYIYTRWADIMPTTIHEKWEWDVDNAFISLSSDNSLTQRRFLEAQYLPFSLPGNTIFLMGSAQDFQFFQKHSDSDVEFSIAVGAFEKVSELPPDDAETVRAKLFEKAWKPWFFAEGFPPHTLKIEAYNGSDIVAIIRTISGHAIPPSEGGGIQVTAEVVYPIKGTKTGEDLTIFYAAGSLQRKYIANLVWDSEHEGYVYYDPNMDIPVIELRRSEYHSIQSFMKSWGIQGEPVRINEDLYYLPICKATCDSLCQRKFEYVQYMLNNGMDTSNRERVE